ncbi:MAG: excinuclease ABC subunit UvrA [Chthoniobacteraceae bacterium]
MKKNLPARPPATVPAAGVVRIRGARQNNLKGFDLDLPLGQLNVISGPSGCGKSSLAFDTIYAEGQRRYVETFSPYTRQFMDRMDKPQVDEILGIPPAIAIEQANHVKSTRSTVGTMTEINDYLKLLMPLVAEASCPSCSRPIRPETAQSIVREIFARCAGQPVLVTFGVPAPVGTKPEEFFDFLRQQGYLRVWLEGEVTRLDEAPKLKRLPPVVQVIQDRVTVNEENRGRIAEAVETALRFGKGKLTLIPANQPSTPNHQLPFSSGWHCPHCDLEITPPSAGLFSFNHPLGACPDCKGFGGFITIDLERAIPNRSLSIKGGVVKPFQTENGQECQRDLLKAAARKEVDVDCPYEDLPEADQHWVLYGEPRSEDVTGDDLWKAGLWYGVKGFFNWLESKSYKMHVRVLLSRYRSYTVCPQCNGGRFQPAVLNFRAAGKTLPELMVMSADSLLPILREASGPVVDETGKDDSTREMLREAITSRLRYLVEVGLGYLSLDRPTRTLSGGEVERVNLTTCLGASLVNTLFVLDEPSVGLHPRDVGRLVKVMRELRDKGNTLLVVEHEEAVLRAADNLVELGPWPRRGGRRVVFHGPLDAALKLKGGQSLTADYLSGRQQIEIPQERRKPTSWIGVEGAKEHNLRDVSVEFPLGVFACITGVSGSGKSTLVHEVLYRNLLRARGEACEEAPGACRRLTGFDRVSGVVMVDQSPLARTPRSSVALYLGVFDYVREAFATSPDAGRRVSRRARSASTPAPDVASAARAPASRRSRSSS